MVLQCMLDITTDRWFGWVKKNDSKGEEEGFKRAEGKPQAALPKINGNLQTSTLHSAGYY